MRVSVATALAVILVACSHGVRESPELAPSRDADYLTAADFAEVKGGTLYDAVQQLRPAWILRTRPNPVLPTQSNVMIYIDGARYGAGIDGLRTLALSAIATVRYFSPVEATARFGPGHPLGAIEVTTVPQ
jgi:hypothetical protein